MILGSMLKNSGKKSQQLTLVNRPISEEPYYVQVFAYGVMTMFVLLCIPVCWHFIKVTFKHIKRKINDSTK